MGVPGTPHKGGLHDLLKLLWKLPEQLELLHYMERTIEPMIFSLKLIYLFNVTHSILFTGGVVDGARNVS